MQIFAWKEETISHIVVMARRFTLQIIKQFIVANKYM